MTSKAPIVELPNAPIPSTTPRSTKLPEPLAGSKRWNTNNLGLRLGSDLAAACSAAALVAPVITIIDKAIMQKTSGQQKSLRASLTKDLSSMLLRPHIFFFSKPFLLICMLYGGTYFTANAVDTIASTVGNKPATHVTSGTLKFAASSTANVSLCLFKDQAFARLFGPSGPPRPVSLPSYALFTLRDCLTIFASFNIPPLIGPVISKKMGTELQKSMSGQTVAQFLAPATVQIVSTPLHLLGLDLYNRSDKSVSWGARWHLVRKNWTGSAVARMCRIIPAFGVGGVVNSKIRQGLISRLE